jgi:cytoskeletal protein RodZ
MVEAHEQAKQLDSVTDQVHEKEVDASKALQAMSSLSIGGGGGERKGGPATPPSSSASTSKSPASSDDSGKAAAASKGGPSNASSTSLVVAPIVVDPKDVQLIVDELEVTHEAAEKALRRAIAEGTQQGAAADPPVVGALRILVTSI